MKNKLVIITGASSGIGKACAEKFAQEGANLVLAARSSDKLREVAENLSGKEKFYFNEIANDKFDKYLNSLRLHKPDSYSFLLGKITENNHIIASAGPKEVADYLKLIKHNVNILLQAAQYTWAFSLK